MSESWRPWAPGRVQARSLREAVLAERGGPGPSKGRLESEKGSPERGSTSPKVLKGGGVWTWGLENGTPGIQKPISGKGWDKEG